MFRKGIWIRESVCQNGPQKGQGAFGITNGTVIFHCIPKLPEGEYDDIFLFAIVHMESDNNVQKLLKNIYKLLKPKGRLFLTRFFLDEDKISPEFSVMFAVQMLINSKNGKVYTHNEITNHIKNAGFSKIDRINDIPSQATLYVAEKQTMQ